MKDQHTKELTGDDVNAFDNVAGKAARERLAIPRVGGIGSAAVNP